MAENINITDSGGKAVMKNSRFHHFHHFHHFHQPCGIVVEKSEKCNQRDMIVYINEYCIKTLKSF